MTDLEKLVRDAVRRYNARDSLRRCGLCRQYQDTPIHNLGCLAGKDIHNG